MILDFSKAVKAYGKVLQRQGTRAEAQEAYEADLEAQSVAAVRLGMRKVIEESASILASGGTDALRLYLDDQLSESV